jgi:hypothetical protein
MMTSRISKSAKYSVLQICSQVYDLRTPSAPKCGSVIYFAMTCFSTIYILSNHNCFYIFFNKMNDQT